MTRQWQRQLFILLGLWLTWGTLDVWAGVTPSHLSRDSLQAQSPLEIQELPLVIEGRLDENGEMGSDGRLVDIYPFLGTAGDILVIELVSHDVNAGWLFLDWEGNLIGPHPEERNTEETVRVELPRTGVYGVVVYGRQPGETGNYHLTVRPATAAGGEETRLLEEAHHLNQRVLQLYEEGRYQEAIPLEQRALEIRETALGESHPLVAESLNNLAQLYHNQGNYHAAEPLYLRSLEIRETALGESHPDVATSLNNLALLYWNQGNYDAAEPLYLRSLEIRETALGESHPSVAASLNNLAALYRSQGNYDAAEPLLLRSLEILETALGESHPHVATSLNNLAQLYRSQGNYDAAEPLYLRSLEIYQTALGESHPDIAGSLNNLAQLYRSQGNYDAAELFYLRSLEIYQTALGESHPHVASSLNSLAELYRAQGNYDAAEPLFLRSLEIYQTALGESHPHVAASLNNLAVLYRDQGNYDAAEPLFLRSLEIRETALGESHPDVAQSLNNLAALYHGQGNYDAAEPLYLRSLEIYQTALGEFHPDVAQSLNNLAALYHAQGNYDAAEPLYLQSLEILETALGESHPNVATSLINLAGLHQSQGDISQSLSFRQRGLGIQETNLTQNLSIGSEARKQAYIATLSSTTHRTLSLHLQDAPDHPEAAHLALTTVLRRKGRILDAVTETQQLLRDNLSPELAPLLDEYTNAQTQLATRLYASLGNQDPDIYRSEIDALRQQVEQLEDDLSRRSAEFRVATEPVEIEAVQALIPTDAALVELVQYRPWSQGWGTPRYAAYILHSSGDPQWVDLGDAETIDNAAFAFLNATRVPNSEQRVQTTGRQLDELLMAPIRPLLGDATHLLLSPDGQLNLIPFAALVDEENRYLVQSYQLTHLTTGRDLLRLQNPRPSRQPPVLFANPNYDDADTSAVTQVAQATRGESQRSMEIEDLQFGELPGTQREVEAIAPLLDNPIVLTEAEATENALKQVQAPSILHLATHGFFLQDVEFVPPQPLRDFTRGEIELVTARPLEGWFLPPSDRPTSSENPLLRSGLALAGFNSRDSEGEDGVLTALEVVGLDLRGTRLVVMSACETGVGDVANGEGVYGLRRAFVMAGAESQLMSLWKVADEETADLMGDYYQRLLAGEGRSEALREVQLDWLSRGAHPYYWASFLFSGQWTPMDDFTEK
ncbi:tetratricopeptide repeat protein [Geitlerinema sp. P-1104]|uniref:CHAT domain-containing tetratricopeptide repeat protein n=1 Tax=Geitlerinema sp. P-1104 TaxID=2546230 RepID=UPI00147708A6|nr:CHAT domain-containing tetratricopeptide repeat protein [Geitlerinema sp. P-1104]NMG60492.1 tetratricopeptide repeat protein [Geitlerinema sp. P-1104]